MQSFTASQDVTIAVPLARDGEPFVPDANMATVTLRDHDGSVLDTVTHTDVTDSTLPVMVGAAYNAITRTFEKRTVIVEGMAGGLPFSIRTSYRLSSFLNYTVSPADVRTFTGLDEGELPDSDIDLNAAFLDLGAFDALQTALAGENDRAANNAILAQAVITLLPGLPTRVSKSDSDGTSKVDRFPIDFAALELRARDLRTRSMDVVSPNLLVDRTFLVFANRTDPFTG